MILDYHRSLSREQELDAFSAGDTDSLVCSQIAHVIDICKDQCRRIGCCLDDDILSEGLLALVVAVRKYDASVSRLSTWVRRPITWAVISACKAKIVGMGQPWVKGRKMERVSIEVTDEVPERWTEQGKGLSVDDMLEHIEASLDRLRDIEHEAILLAAKGCSNREIAEKLGVKPHVVQSAVSRARLKLRGSVG